MKKRKQVSLYVSAVLLLGFAVWTALVRFIDVSTIGPQESNVGFATLNGYIHNFIGVNMYLYMVTDWLGLVPICVAFGFGVLGLIQWIKRKSFLKVDRNILVLGGFYIVVMAVYILFEKTVINYRPVLIEGCLEGSYPSSTTMLVLCVMPTAMMQFSDRIKRKTLRFSIVITFAAFTAFMVIGRFLSGVHWATDIIGGVLVSSGLVALYYHIAE